MTRQWHSLAAAGVVMQRQGVAEYGKARRGGAVARRGEAELGEGIATHD